MAFVLLCQAAQRWWTNRGHRAGPFGFAADLVSRTLAQGGLADYTKASAGVV